MFDYDAIIIGGGPAGLTAGLYLSQGMWRTLLLERETFGGPTSNYEYVENYPGFPEGVSGADLGSRMVTQATKFGLELKNAEVVGIELYGSCMYAMCAGGTGYSTSVIIIAGGCRPKKLGVPGEERLQGKGIFTCGFCDGSQYVDRVVAVCGGGDAGVTEALYMKKLASKVILFEVMPDLTASPILQERALSNPKLEIRCETKVEAIVGESQVEAIEYLELGGGQRGTLEVDGILVHIGLRPNTSYLKGIVPLDSQGRVIVNEKMETEVPNILAAGDIRSGSLNQIITAAGDGVTAAITAMRQLQ